MGTRFLSSGLSRNIDQGLIDRCDKESIDRGETMFIFDRIDSFDLDTQSDRDIKIESILDEGLFIGDVSEFSAHVSRWSYYDTITRTTNQSMRYHKVYTFITEKIGIFEKKSILDSTKEIIFSAGPVRLILKPNLLIEIAYIHSIHDRVSCGLRFFDPQWILNSISSIPIDVRRNLKISIITSND